MSNVTVLITGWDADGASYDVITTNEGFSNRKSRHTTEHYGDAAGKEHPEAEYEFVLHEETGEQFLLVNAGYLYEATAEVDGEPLSGKIILDARERPLSIRVPEGHVVESVEVAGDDVVEAVKLKTSIDDASSGSTGDNEDDPTGSDTDSASGEEE